MRLLRITVLSMSLLAGIASCSPEERIEYPETDRPDNSGKDDGANGSPSDRTLTIRTGGGVFTAVLADNAAAATFVASLPQTVRMNDQGGNEKYYNLPGKLPTDTYRPGTIRTGDLLLWGNDCIVLFYKTFQSPYRYTRIGNIDDPEGLAEALGSGTVTVTFE